MQYGSQKFSMMSSRDWQSVHTRSMYCKLCQQIQHTFQLYDCFHDDYFGAINFGRVQSFPGLILKRPQRRFLSSQTLATPALLSFESVKVAPAKISIYSRYESLNFLTKVVRVTLGHDFSSTSSSHGKPSLFVFVSLLQCCLRAFVQITRLVC